MNAYILTLCSFLVGSVIAATPSADINDLKERLATKVAQLRQTQKKAIAGIVKETTISTFTVETVGSNVKIERTDDISVFQNIKGKRTELTTDNIEKNDFVVVFGDHDTGLDLLNAKVVFIQNPPLERVTGVVTEINRTAFTATIKSPEGQDYIIDIEKSTIVLQFTKEKGLIRGGFSKLMTGATVHIVGSAVPKKENQISALRVVDLGNLSGVTPTPTEKPTPTASASGTPKSTPKPTTTPTS